MFYLSLFFESIFCLFTHLHRYFNHLSVKFYVLTVQNNSFLYLHGHLIVVIIMHNLARA